MKYMQVQNFTIFFKKGSKSFAGILLDEKKGLQTAAGEHAHRHFGIPAKHSTTSLRKPQVEHWKHTMKEKKDRNETRPVRSWPPVVL